MDTLIAKESVSELDVGVVQIQPVDNPDSSDFQPTRRQRVSAIASVFFAGIAILSDGYNGAIIGNLDLVFSALYPHLGFVIGGIVPLVVLFAFHQRHLEVVWRLCLAIGAILPLTVFWFRLKMVPSRQYEKHALRKNIPYRIILKYYYRPIIVTSALFFLYDYIAWPFSLFASNIFAHFNVGDSIWKNIAWGTLIKIGRRRTMAAGFAVQAVLGFIIGGTFNQLVANAFGAFVFLYALFVAVGEVGPGSGMILVSAESFPTAIRGQGLGIASAFGKAGAAIGSQVFTAILAKYENSTNPNKGSQVAFLIGSAFAVLGALVAFFGLQDQRADLEVQDAVFREILVSEGIDVSGMGYNPEKEVLENAVAKREK